MWVYNGLTRIVLMSSLRQSEINRLIQALGLGRLVTGFELSFDVDRNPSITVRRLLTAEEVEALAEWYETEGVSLVEAEITYNLERKEPEADAAT